MLSCLVARSRIEIGQVAVPSQADDVDDQNSMLQGHKGEVRELHGRPYQPVGLESWKICLFQSLLWRLTLEIRHG